VIGSLDSAPVFDGCLEPPLVQHAGVPEPHGPTPVGGVSALELEDGGWDPVRFPYNPPACPVGTWTFSGFSLGAGVPQSHPPHVRRSFHGEHVPPFRVAVPTTARS